MEKQVSDSLVTPKYVIFDWDNTLVSTWGTIVKIMDHVLAHFGMEPWTIDEIKQKTHLSAKDYFPVVFGDKTAEAFRVLRQYATLNQKTQLEELKAMEGAENLLKKLQDLKIPCAILSNKQGDRLRIEVQHMGWGDYFVGIFGSTDFLEDKPSGLPAREILKKFGWDAQQTWFVGDTPVDWLCAKNSGCTPISIVKDCLELEPHVIFDGCHTLEKRFF
jgi:phosphoglycolate phosphatase